MKKIFSFLAIMVIAGFITVSAQEALPFSESFDGSGMPVGWSTETGAADPVWEISLTSNAGGTANELMGRWRSYDGTSRCYTPALDTTGISMVVLNFRQYYDDYGAGVTIKVQYSTDGTTWIDSGWEILGGSGDTGPSEEEVYIPSTADTLYIAWVVDGNHFQINYWYIDDVVVTEFDGILFPWTETFEDDSATRDDWTQIYEVGTGDWTWALGSSGGLITTAHNGVLNARYVSASGTNDPVTKLVTPVLDISGMTNPTLEFWYGQDDWAGDQNTLEVYYRVSEADPWVSIWFSDANVDVWTEVILELPDQSADYQIAFEAANNWGYANVLDDVSVYDVECYLQDGLDNPDLEWTTSTWPEGLNEWYCQTEHYYYGGSAAQSGAILDNQSTSIHTSVTGPGYLGWWWMVDSPYGYLELYLNGIFQTFISGTTSWNDYGLLLPAGEHAITWTFSKIINKGDGSKQTDDSALLDYFIWIPMSDGPDASINESDISYSPSAPMPGDTVTISAIVRNLEFPVEEPAKDVMSGNASFYYSLEPGVDLQLIETVAFGQILPQEFVEVSVDWVTDPGMDPRTYVITVVLTDILPEDVDPSNNEASIDLALPVILGYFTANGMGNRVNVQWQTLSEVNNLGFNLYRMKGDKVSPFISFTPVKLNDTLIQGQGNSSSPSFYSFIDSVKNGGNYIYILESVSTIDMETEEYRTKLEWLF